MAQIDNLMAQRARAKQGKSPDEQPEDEDDFGLFYPLWYAFDTWIEHEDHGLYPEIGGYADQCWQLMQDWKILDRRYGKAERGDRSVLDSLGAYAQQGAKDWSQL